MTISVQKGDPKSPDALELLQASHTLMESLYPSEHNHYLSVDELCVPSITFLIATRGDQTIGCAALANKGDYGEIKSMYVDAGARGSGAADALMAALDETARADGLQVMRLETGDTLHAAHKLYERHGFRSCNKFGEYEDGPHSVFMEKALG